jgi:2-polyprenyl-3-methyl-5-hydroxy-6-metoxy-1,4-benzoquinol methylase
MKNLNKYRKDFLNLEFERKLEVYRKKKLVKIVSELTYNSVLEIGCGIDTISNYLDNNLSFTIVEPIKEFCDLAVKNIDNNTNLKVYNSFIEDFKSDKCFDLIIVNCLLHEIHDKLKFISCIKNLMSQNSYVFFTVPNKNSLHRLLALKMGLIENIGEESRTQINLQQSNQVFSLKSFSSFLNSSGFDVLKKGGYFIKPFTHDQMKQILDNGIIDDKVLNGLYLAGEEIQDLSSEIYCLCKIKN